LNVAAFLDPIYIFKQLDPFVAETEREDVIEDVISELLFSCEEDNDTTELPQMDDDDDEDSEQIGPATKKRKERVLSRLLGDMIKTKSSKEPTNL